jgi:TPR repeat protein
MFSLGNCYFNRKEIARNEEEAFPFLKLVVDQDDTNAMFKLGTCYRDGHEVAQNKKKAFQFLKLVANHI